MDGGTQIIIFCTEMTGHLTFLIFKRTEVQYHIYECCFFFQQYTVKKYILLCQAGSKQKAFSHIITTWEVLEKQPILRFFVMKSSENAFPGCKDLGEIYGVSI